MNRGKLDEPFLLREADDICAGKGRDVAAVNVREHEYTRYTVEELLNPFIPEFFNWTLPSLNVDTSTNSKGF